MTCLDARTGNLQLVYNRGESARQQPLLGDGKLRATTFLLTGLRPQSMKHGFDFVIQGDTDTEEVIVSMVRTVATR